MDLWLYVYGNGDFIYQILISVNFFMHHAGSFFKLAAMLSLVMFAAEATGVVPMRGGFNWTRFIKMYAVLAIFILTPYPGAVNVHDVITNEDRVVNMRDGQLPFELIFPVAVTSTIMYRLINLYQQNFEIDSNLSYTYSGMNFGANFIASLDNANSYNDTFNRNFDQYMQNCGFPLMYKKGALSVLRSSSDIFATLMDAQYTSSSRFVQQVSFTPPQTTSVTTCSEAIAGINTYYNTNKDAILQTNANNMGVSSTGYDRFINSANATANTLMGISQGASQALKQAIGMNMIMTSLKNGALSTGDSSLALAAYDGEQFQTYKAGGQMSGAASARSVPILVWVAFAMLFFLYPIMIFLALMMGSYKAIGVFLQIVLAINLMPLIFEILNYMTTFYLQKKLGITIQGQAYNYDVSTSLYSFTDNMIVAGNYLATSTPIIAYAIATGSTMALTSVFGHINDPAKSAAGKSGDELAHGNMNMGNTSMDNHSFNNLSGNKLDDQVSMNSGVPMMKNVTSGGTHTDFNGKGYDINNKSDMLSHINYQDTASKTLTNSLNQSHQDMASTAKQWGHSANRNHDLANSTDSNDNRTLSDGTSVRDAYTQQQGRAEAIQKQLE
ncbi:MAG: conjugal transfer protein TraG N-terminal domain-containing protein [Burkholderiales bacterium]|nr:conjugal transfer protein TraG N-terminal domain-containing protein [Burkholderiales bacterium]